MQGNIAVLLAIPEDQQILSLLGSEVIIASFFVMITMILIVVAGEPTRLKTVFSGSNTTHVNVTVSWKSPGGNISGYMIYYQTEGGPVISDKVSGGERETHSLDGLQRGVT